MMARAFVVLALIGLTSSASAETYAVAVNAPTSWIGRGAFGATGYRVLHPHHGLRANIATYEYASFDTAFSSALGIPMGDDELDGTGRVYDAAFGWQAYKRRPLDGFSFDVDLLLRRTSTQEDAMDGSIERRAETFIGVRVMGSWFWRIEDRFFVSASAGFAQGRMWVNRETLGGSYARSENDARVEGFVRFGAILDP